MKKQITRIKSNLIADENGATATEYKITLSTQDGNLIFVSGSESLFADLIEIQEEFCADVKSFEDVGLQDIKVHSKTWQERMQIKAFMDWDNRTIWISTYDGDAKQMTNSQVPGTTFAQAIFAFAKHHGFKSTLKSNEEFGLHKWFLNFNYGLEKLSNEILQKEMDEMFCVDKGTW